MSLWLGVVLRREVPVDQVVEKRLNEFWTQVACDMRGASAYMAYGKDGNVCSMFNMPSFLGMSIVNAPCFNAAKDATVK